MAETRESLRTLLRADARRSRALQRSRFGYDPRTWWLDPGFVAVLLHRIAHRCHARGWGKAARLAMQLDSLLTGADFHPGARVGPGLLVPSPCSTNLSCVAGRNLLLMPQAGIGGSLATTDIGAGPGLPLLGDDVRVGQFAGVNGPFAIGDRVQVAPGAGTVRSVAADRESRMAAEPLLLTAAPATISSARDIAPCAHRSWRATFADWRADVRRWCAEEARYDGIAVTRGKLASAALTNPMMMLLVQRAAHHLHVSGWRRLAAWGACFNRLLYKISIPADTCLGGGVLIPHLAGLAIEGEIGNGVTFYANSVCAGWSGDRGDRPAIGTAAIVGGHGGVIGSVRLGAGGRLAPKVQLIEDVDDGTEVFSPLARFRDDPLTAGCADGADRESTPPLLPDREVRRADRLRYRTYLAGGGRPYTAGRIAVLLYRRSGASHAAGRLRTARGWWLANVYLTGADIAPDSRIGRGLLIPYPAGIAFRGAAGADLTLMAMCGVGAWPDATDRLPPTSRCPILGDGVRLDHHAQVHGAVRIGSGVRIMPGCTASNDVAENMVVAARPVRLRRPGAAPTVARR